MTCVSIVRCGSYEYKDVRNAVEQSLLLLGGVERYIQPNSRVLVKPNILRGADPKKAVTTNPAVVKAVCELLEKIGCEIIVADSPGGLYSRNRLEKIYKITGLTEALRDTTAILNYNTETVEVSFPDAYILRRFRVIKPVMEADHIITIPKLKNHVFTGFTGATKILYGVIPGMDKVFYHLQLKNLNNFSLMLLDLIRFIRPSLNIMDGIIGMEGDGPNSGIPRYVGVILSSSDPFALDYVALKIINREPKKLVMIKQAISRGLSKDLDNIEVIGSTIDMVKIYDFIPPSDTGGLFNKIPGFIKKAAINIVAAYPEITKECVGCGICREHCPVSAIRIENSVACIDYNRCIRCYCCHEFCPHSAVKVKKGYLARLLRL